MWPLLVGALAGCCGRYECSDSAALLLPCCLSQDG